MDAADPVSLTLSCRWTLGMSYGKFCDPHVILVPGGGWGGNGGWGKQIRGSGSQEVPQLWRKRDVQTVMSMTKNDCEISLLGEESPLSRGWPSWQRADCLGMGILKRRWLSLDRSTMCPVYKMTKFFKETVVNIWSSFTEDFTAFSTADWIQERSSICILNSPSKYSTLLFPICPVCLPSQIVLVSESRVH